MPSTSRLLRALRHEGIPGATRIGLLRLELARRLRPRPAYPLPLGGSSVFLSHDDYEIDWKTLAFVVLDDAYAGDYLDAVVVDIGAHKGYFAAYTLHRGARAVVSYEPEQANFDLLERSAAAHRGRGGEWHTWQAAVGAEPGEAELHVMGASWGHALHPPDEFSQYEVGVQQVSVTALADALADAHSLAGDSRLVVKLNIEGEECPVVLGTPPSAWEAVAEAFVETHPWAACDAEQLAEHLAPAGLRRCESSHRAVLRLQREGSTPAGPHSAPR